MCGEQNSFILPAEIDTGSPPRVRGTVHHGLRHDHIQGITPACAGNSPRWHVRPFIKQDHPRVCGEQAFPAIWDMIQPGSPPRVRGTVAKPLLYIM